MQQQELYCCYSCNVQIFQEEYYADQSHQSFLFWFFLWGFWTGCFNHNLNCSFCSLLGQFFTPPVTNWLICPPYMHHLFCNSLLPVWLAVQLSITFVFHLTSFFHVFSFLVHFFARVLVFVSAVFNVNFLDFYFSFWCPVFRSFPLPARIKQILLIHISSAWVVCSLLL